MYVLERDQYADTHLRSGPRLRFWLLWLLATGVSFFVAHLIAQVPDQAEQFGGLLYWGFLVARGAAFGVVIGAAQGLVLLMYVRKSAWPQWVLASALGWAVRALFLYFISDWLENSFLSFGTAGLAAATSLGGLVLGAAVGLPQSFVLRPYVDHPNWWVFANAGGTAIGRAVAAVGLLAGVLGDATMLATVDVVVTTVITGFLLVDMLRSSSVRATIQQNEQVTESLQIATYPLGQAVAIGPGLALTFHEAAISSDSIVWRGTVRNDTEADSQFTLAEASLEITDSTQKPYVIRDVTVSSGHVPAHSSAQVTVTATILPYSPIPEGATHLDLRFTLDNSSAVVFRRNL